MAKPVVTIVMGSDSDLAVMDEAAKVLEIFDVPYEMTVSSAHRAPDRTLKIAETAEKRGIKVIIAGAGYAAHLAGFIAAKTTLPVIGVPIDSSALNGLDSLLSTVQMPAGVPVATVSIGSPGATNAGVLAAQILALADTALAARLVQYKKKLAEKVEAAA